MDSGEAACEFGKMIGSDRARHENGPPDGPAKGSPGSTDQKPTRIIRQNGRDDSGAMRLFDDRTDYAQTSPLQSPGIPCIVQLPTRRCPDFMLVDCGYSRGIRTTKGCETWRLSICIRHATLQRID